ncbi:MAG: SDR family NAD(P)-dependent oxidoreductase, partial [Luteibaculum sp.]
DVSKEDVGQQTEKMLESYGMPDLVFLNAGISQRAITREASPELLKRLMDVNYFGVVNPFLVLLKKRDPEKLLQVVVTNSVAGKFGYWMRSGYAASKHALRGFFDTVALEEYGKNLVITQIFPGRINTPINKNALYGSGSSSEGNFEGFSDAMATGQLVKKMLRAVKKEKAHVIIARLEWIPWTVYRISKRLFFSFFSKRPPE